jgi:hypothetical protein
MYYFGCGLMIRSNIQPPSSGLNMGSVPFSSMKYVDEL